MGLLKAIFGAKTPPVHIDDSNFEAEVLKSDVPVILDAWSPGCAPCKRLEEVMMRLSTTYSGRVKVCEMNVQGAPRASMTLKVASTPSVFYFLDSELKERVMGYRSSLYHEEAIEELFGISKKG